MISWQKTDRQSISIAYHELLETNAYMNSVVCGEQTTSALEARHRQLEQTVSSLTDNVVDKQSLIDTLQQQVIIYREDFQTERRDRERAQSHISELQTQIDDLIQSQHRTSATASQVHQSTSSSTLLTLLFVCLAPS